MTEPASRDPDHGDRVTVIAGQYEGCDGTIEGKMRSGHGLFFLLGFHDGRKKDLVPASMCRLIADD
jgi:hypothetical protein